MNLTENTNNVLDTMLHNFTIMINQILEFQKIMDSLEIEPPVVLTQRISNNEIKEICVIHTDFKKFILQHNGEETIHTTILQRYVTIIHDWLENDTESIRIVTKLLNAEEYQVSKGTVTHKGSTYNLPKTIDKVLLISEQIGGIECQY